MQDDIDVLVVEDSQVQALRLRLILEDNGYRVTTAADGLEALDLLKENFYSIVITDWLMPKMSGIELCRTVRGQEFKGYVYMLFVTQKDCRQDIVNGLNAGADDYLAKPIDPGELLARVNTAKRIVLLEQALKEQNEQIRHMAMTDSMTGVRNTRYMTDNLPAEIKRAERYNRPLSVILGDIDRFKEINDTYGHPAGDEALRSVSQCMAQSIRDEIDWISRYGGEEFVIVLPETEIDGALKAAERIRKRISELSIRLGDLRFGVTMSFGVACMSPAGLDHDMHMQSVIEIADRCLYRAKKAGRNRCFGDVVGRRGGR